MTDDCCIMILTALPESAAGLCILLQTVPHSADILSTFPDVPDPRASLFSLLSAVPSTTLGRVHTYSSNQYGTGQMDCSNDLGSTVQTMAVMTGPAIIFCILSRQNTTVTCYEVWHLATA